jgi:hypothetical protein
MKFLLIVAGLSLLVFAQESPRDLLLKKHDYMLKPPPTERISTPSKFSAEEIKDEELLVVPSETISDDSAMPPKELEKGES